MLTVNGYHPLSEDGGVYVAGVQYQLDSTLYPHLTSFVTAHLRWSVFAPVIAGLARSTQLPLSWVLLLVYAFSLWLTLCAGLAVLRRCISAPTAQLAGVTLLAVWTTLPVAGTSLVLVDPYLTARSLSTPLSLLAIAFAMDVWPSSPRSRDGWRSAAACLICLALAALLHPLMAGYALAVVVALRLVRLRLWLPVCLAAAALIVAVTSVLNALAPAESPALVAASVSRYYWFLSQWQWYELAGLIGPVVILTALLRWQSADLSAEARLLLRACLVTGAVAVLVALLFAHRDAATHMVARLQPLRVFLLVYAVMALLLGASLMQGLLSATAKSGLRITIAALFLLANAAALFSAQRAIYPASGHLELPWSAPVNPWSRAFLWARNNTPRDALFALDAHYITTAGEDAQTFRATALRSALPDFSKDGGEASITPSLAEAWQQDYTLQLGLSAQPDSVRDARLIPSGVTWMILHPGSVTAHACPYDNGTVKVCRLVP